MKREKNRTDWAYYYAERYDKYGGKLQLHLALWYYFLAHYYEEILTLEAP